MKKPKPETELRNLRRELKQAGEDRCRLTLEKHDFRARATRAEQEAAEWKRRYDTAMDRIAAALDRIAPPPKPEVGAQG